MGRHGKDPANDEETGAWADPGGWFPRWLPTIVTVLALLAVTLLMTMWLVQWLSN